MTNVNFQDRDGVTHEDSPRVTMTAYNALSWRAKCGAPLIGMSYVKCEVDCIACIANGA